MNRSDPWRQLTEAQQAAPAAPIAEAPAPHAPPAPRPNVGGRPTSGRPHKIIGYVSEATRRWLKELEHTRRADGSYPSSLAEVIEEQLTIARLAGQKKGD